MLDLTCGSDCKYQKNGQCTLERADWVRSCDGAECMSHIFEQEDHCRF